MRIVRANVALPRPEGYTLQPGCAYIFNGKHADLIEKQAIAKHGAMAVDIDPERLEWVYKKWDGETDLDGKVILFWRTGGAGDLIEMDPLMQFIKRRWPTCKIILCCDVGYTSLFHGAHHIDEVRPYPVQLAWLKEADFHQFFEAVVEENPDAKRTPHPDLFLNEFGGEAKTLTPFEKIPVLSVSEEAIKSTDELFAAHNIGPQDFTVGIQLIVDAKIRRYEPWKLAAIAKDLVGNHRAKIVWIGSPRQADEITRLGVVKHALEKSCLNLASQKNFTWQHTFAAIAKCDIVLSADSSANHIAGSFKRMIGPAGEGDPWTVSKYQFGLNRLRSHTPQVGIYGPFDPAMRQKYFYDAFGVDVNCICAHCFQHGHEACYKGDPSPCFGLIPPSDPYGHVMLLTALTNRPGQREMTKKVENLGPYDELAASLIASNPEGDQPDRMSHYREAFRAQEM